MKKIFIILLFIISHSLFSQVYYQKDFGLSDNVKKINVLCYDLKEENNELVESFPYSIQTAYKTDLNLYYLEFYKDGTLKKSRLFYPRDFYGQFSLLEPFLDLESSDFGNKINYLTKSYRYSYTKNDEILTLTLTEENNTQIDILLKDNFMLEDEYYSYNLIENNGKKTLVKKRKGSNYGFRRIEEENKNNLIIKNEYINNRFLIAKETYKKNEERSDYIKVTQSRINLKKLEYNNDGLVEHEYLVDLSWRNKFSKWPDIDFFEGYNYDSYLNDLERDFTQTYIEYNYDNLNRLIEKYTYLINNNKRELLLTEKFEYNKDSKIKVHLVNNNYKEYQYDLYGNWNIKILGKISQIDNVDIRIPNKKYIRTLTFWN